jgi:uracil-DNA glycosylase family 4
MTSPCSLCPRLPRRRPIPPDGPVPCPLVLLGEGPAWDEDEQFRVFSGKTGIELNQTYLPILGLPRSSVFIANVSWCSQPSYQNPTREQAYSCASTHLAPLLAAVRPLILAPMGAVACSLWPGINVTHDHGIPRVEKWGGWEGVVYPLFHPSAGIHMTAYMIPLMEDFRRLGELLRTLEAL